MSFSRSLILVFSLSAACLPSAADAQPIRVGDKVLVSGSFQRKCAAHVAALPDAQHAQLEFDAARCGNASRIYQIKHLQHLSSVSGFKTAGQELRTGDSVLVPGYFSGICGGRVKEISRNGYVSVDFDSAFCADTAALRKTSELTRVSFVEEMRGLKHSFKVGEQVSVPGINSKAGCEGKITRLTANGFAAVSFPGLTCAVGGAFYPLDRLQPKRQLEAANSLRHRRAESIFQNVMREIASKH